MFVSSGGGKELSPRSPKATGEYKSVRWDVPHSHCSACVLTISSPHSNAKYVMELDVMVEESAQLNSSCVHKLVRVGYHWTGDLVSDELLPEDLVRGPLPRRIQDVSEDPGPRLRHPLQRRRRQQARPPCRGLPFRMCVRPPKPTYPLRRPSSTGHPKILGPS
ncbi:hypothetical protein GW17_00046923 [Ensete ventricosum]|nr:hypothetical protein GW17_00046923 [Ensete ventricosum]